MLMNKQELLQSLKTLSDFIEDGTSVKGGIEYDYIIEDDTYDVYYMIKCGNTVRTSE